LKNILELGGLRRLLTSINPRTIYLYSVVIGVLSGLGALAFNELLHAVTEITMHGWAQVMLPEPLGEMSEPPIPTGPPRRWVLFFLPVVGGLISGLLVKTFAPEAQGTGTDGYIDAFHNKAGSMRGRVPLVKSLATLSTLASGGSAGKEGPIAQIGAGIGSALGRSLKMGARARRTMMVAGAAGGLGAIFRAPLGGALTAVEVLYKEDIETDALTPAILSSVTAYTVFCSVKGFDHVFAFAGESFHTPIQLLFYAVLGLVCSGAGYVYVHFLHGSKRLFFDRLPINKYLVPPLGGLLVGTVGLAYPQAMGQGFGYVQQLILGQPIDGIKATVGFLATGLCPESLHWRLARRMCRNAESAVLSRSGTRCGPLCRRRHGGILCWRGERTDRITDDGLRADGSLRTPASIDGGGHRGTRHIETLVNLYDPGGQQVLHQSAPLGDESEFPETSHHRERDAWGVWSVGYHFTGYDSRSDRDARERDRRDRSDPAEHSG